MSQDKKTKPEAWTDHREIRLSASPERVWAAWGQPEIIQQWFPDEARGQAVPGSTLTHVWKAFGFEMEHRVVEAEPGKKLVLEADSPAGHTFRQEIRIRREGGETVMELIHSGFGEVADWSDEYQGIDSGWKLTLATLRHYLEKYYGRPRTTHFVMRPAVFDFSDLDRVFRSEPGLSLWLTSKGAIGDRDAPCNLLLKNGWRLTGRVLAWSGFEAAVSWREFEGVLELKAINMGPTGRTVAMRLSSWARNGLSGKDIHAWMHGALEELAACGFQQ